MTNDDLIYQIEIVRNTMITVGMAKGLNSSETILLSKKLDRLLNLQYRNQQIRPA
ncbi:MULTISPECIES: aspartyl-phosphate phosphatase Spo0E family protein [Bacillus]|uniref:Aspartyl-phosphate phosphatase Spo0E family protein n=1 Tax=Bacillus xiapuensis TaxID=2014075 RepID=A0ABU6ND31_9BACI|nr:MULTISPECIES: aspartyl-phosphate phosphatase Spo0E family protein [Bacillus]MED3563727.1 aspartyl-phosphate phosphatase Spo0E family protein [Bacillus xiapuensis]